MDNRLTSFILQYLLENSFESKAEMARQFEMDERYIQKLLKNAKNAKGGTIALQKALVYCVQRHIPISNIIDAFVDEETEEGSDTAQRAAHGRQAYMNLRIVRPERLTKEGLETFESMLLFIRKASVKVCPYCKMWCNPWGGRFDVNERDCYVGHLAREISRDVAEFYTEEGEEP